MPDIGGVRFMKNIESGEQWQAQCTDTLTTEPVETIGRFRFFSAAFRKANEALMRAAGDAPQWLLIDEIGKLELEGKGFAPALLAILKEGKPKNLLLVVRDSLITEVLEFFSINNTSILHKLIL